MQINKLRKECNRLRKQASQKNGNSDESEKIIDDLRTKLYQSYNEIIALKQSIGKFSSQNVDQ